MESIRPSPAVRQSNSVPLRAVKVEAFTAASPSALATALNTWVAANSGQRTMLDLSFHVASVSSYAAFLTYTE